MFHSEYSYQTQVKTFMYNVYGLMSGALLTTAATAYACAHSQTFVNAILTSSMPLILIIVAQFALLIALNSLIKRISFGTAVLLFMLFAISIGLSTSTIFLVYTEESIFMTFLVCAGMFGVMSVYGYVTRTDLSTAGNVAFMGLIGLIIASLINMFMQSTQFQLIISAVGVLIFTVLTAYDTQRLKMLASSLFADRETVAKISVIGALTLYLDFINLFLFLLQFMGKKRND